MRLLTFVCSLLMAVFFASCAGGKVAHLQNKVNMHEERIKRLQSDSIRFSKTIDSLTKVVIEKHNALIKAQKTKEVHGNQVSEQKFAKRKKTTQGDYDKIALYLYNITKSIQWAQSNSQTFRISVVADESFYAILNEFCKNKTVGGKPISVFFAKSNKSLKTSELYFLSGNKIHWLDEIHKSDASNNYLIVSDFNHETDGLHINFYNEADSLRFGINEDELQKTKLTISSTIKSMEH